MAPSEIVRRYHERSKHQRDRYAPGPDGLDWASQPDPFRRFDGAPMTELPLLEGEWPVSWSQLSHAATLSPQAFDLQSIGQLFELSLGVSAWKSYGDNRWALRCNPSSGNLHPTEGYLICPALPGLDAGVYHYRPDQHGLEQRATASFSWGGGVLVALTGIHWREAWKYGMRAFRYCQHDAGHAMAALAYAAALLGWSVQRMSAWGDDEMAALCGIDRCQDFPDGEREVPETLLWIGPEAPPDLVSVLAALKGARWSGSANVLSPTQRDWPDIAAVTVASGRPGGHSATRSEMLPALPAALGTAATDTPKMASQVIRQRRSAQAFDGVTTMRAAHFYRLLDALLPHHDAPPWSLLDAAPAVHPVLFVHRVEGLPPGIYCLPRTPDAMTGLRAAMRADWLWERVIDAPSHLPLYLLAPLDVRSFAATASCHQDIAADSAFMVAMLAAFDDLDAQPWRYRERFIEAGMLGQVLYLEAEAGGLQGTGIGCYFDDVVHRALGLDTTLFQDVYQFTVGQGLVDSRLGSEAGYAALAFARASRCGVD